MSNLLTKELSVAMENNRELSVPDIIDRALKLKYASKKAISWNGEFTENWKTTNSDIYSALKYFNKMNSY